ncbi:MAG: adenine nucleotide alpha hydrolase [Thaumarchaeota archaeon]|nr:adenine nucleotide alpha hydrolase [Candidatus Calditenuaceae archaeon]MCX8203919.1 adenine nucleotide alpha hydrolase [Nitrososphaeria archaeon]MDW8042761.1 ATP-binding protein [Nitrososphaerota archaeon]
MRVTVSWSTGKDSALTLHEVISRGHEVACLLTTLTEGFNRVTMHGVRRELLLRQAESLGLEVLEVWIPPNAPNEVYERRMSEAVERLRTEFGVDAVAFGDIWLEDVRRYREERMARSGVELLFPLWGEDPAKVVERFVGLGYRAVICVVDGDAADPSALLGKELDTALLRSSAAGIDPAGERGEYHTFVYDGPTFSRPVRFRLGEFVVRDGRFHYVDLIPELDRPIPESI